MYQHVFQTQGVMHLKAAKRPALCAMLSVTIRIGLRASMHENETELIWVERGTVEVMVNANKYVSCRRHHRLGARSICLPQVTLIRQNIHLRRLRLQIPRRSRRVLILEPDSFRSFTQHFGVDTIRTLFREFDARNSGQSSR